MPLKAHRNLRQSRRRQLRIPRRQRLQQLPMLLHFLWQVQLPARLPPNHTRRKQRPDRRMQRLRRIAIPRYLPNPRVKTPVAMKELGMIPAFGMQLPAIATAAVVGIVVNLALSVGRKKA